MKFAAYLRCSTEDQKDPTSSRPWQLAPLEAGADPAVVAGWIKEVGADRLATERELASAATTAQPLIEDEIRTLVTSQRKVPRPSHGRPRTAGDHLQPDDEPADHVKPSRRASVEVEARPACTNARVGGGT
jgi:hypothetical protein